ncbi:MFS transporter [Luteococcus sp. Sow4_B9]|uniref:MFS transporter n=1 Tax=Luteococcus sp. Sow4_B9 TaxID=3438792 RepID=UPI003F978326
MLARDAKPRLWTRTFTSLTLANFGTAMIFYMLTATLSGWALTDLGASQTEAGLVGTAWFLGAMTARLFAGRMMTQYGERLVVLGSALAMLAGSLLYPWSHSVLLLLALRFVHGISFGVAATALTGTTLARVPIERRGEGSGWFSLGLALATGVGPFVGNVVQASGLGQQGVFWLSVGFALLTVVMSLVVVGDMSGRPAAKQGTKSSLADYVAPSVLPIGLVVAACAMPFGTILTLLMPYARSIGLEKAGGLYFLVYAVVIVFSRPVAGMLQDRLGDTVIMLPIIGAMIAGLLLTIWSPNGLVLLLGGAVLGLGYGTLVPAGQTVAINLVGSARASLGVSSYFLLVDAGTGIGPFVLGALVEPMGYRGALLVGAGCAVAGTLMMGVLHHRMRRRPRERAV